MNILFISHRIPFPANKGEKIRTFNQVKYLAERGHQVTVASPIENADERKFSDQLSEFDNIRCVSRRLPPKALRACWGLFKNKPLSVANFYVRGLQKRIDDLLRSQSFDVIICTSSGVGEYLFKSTALEELPAKPKLFSDFMDLDSDKWTQYSEKTSPPMKWIYQREARLLADYELEIQKKFDACFFISDTEVDLFRKQAKNAENLFTLGNGLDTAEFYPSPAALDNESPTFVFTGVMDYKPNVDAVVWFVENCWSSVLERFPGAEFIIAGMNPSVPVSRLARQPGVTVTGFVEDILPYYHKADYFIAPFRLARGVQNKVLQAFACALPVVTTPMGAEGIHCENGRHLVLAETPQEFVDAISRLHSDAALRDKIKTNALNLIQDEYSWAGKLRVLSDLVENFPSAARGGDRT